jgi:probable rRNA maturation factor
MNRVFVSAEEAPLPGWSGQLNAYALKVLAEVDKDNWDLSVLLCGDKTIQNLNSQYRNRDEATDVLSFELGVEEPGENGDTRCLPGDVVISLETLRKNALYFNVSEDEELRRLLIHGILHLCGMDHETNNDTEPMIVKQEYILEKFKEERILPKGGSSPGGEE